MPDWSLGACVARHEQAEREIVAGFLPGSSSHADRGELLRRDAEWAALVGLLRRALQDRGCHAPVEGNCPRCEPALAMPTPARGEEGT